MKNSLARRLNITCALNLVLRIGNCSIKRKYTLLLLMACECVYELNVALEWFVFMMNESFVHSFNYLQVYILAYRRKIRVQKWMKFNNRILFHFWFDATHIYIFFILCAAKCFRQKWTIWFGIEQIEIEFRYSIY